ncbi:hypothetical protein E3T46_07760 [Cryobacterium sp. Hh11]|uniref:hypothetical protein n=1 Tax=Cryobacterium sp. Hh11 TaxID=2555868 RepID=UPI00106B4DA9|nr:hypothetical protein [Cryobacterium sp. Hh11]TFD51975.1 hypothetical protein E3T46_07760 [Cryobacterium sp. Hh11]
MAFAEVSGTITRIFYNGKGAEVTEVFEKQDGSEGKPRYSLWFAQPHGLNEGDSGKWRGALSVKVDEWTDQQNEIRHSAKVSLNGAKAIEDKSRGQQQPSAPTNAPATGGDTWNAPGSFDDKPF